MANLGYPHIRMYWFKANRIDRIAESMPLNRYFKIGANILVNAAIAPDSNNKTKFWKVEPIISAIRSACLQLPREETCAIDKQMIPFTERVPAKQFIKSQLNPVGLKNFLLCGKSGRMLEFEIYQGDGTSIPTASKYLGLGGSVVMHLAQTVPSNQNFKLYSDNYFTSVSLVSELTSHVIHTLGVVRKQRMSGCQLTGEKELKKVGRGAVDWKVTSDTNVCMVRWLDNGIVTLVSSFAAVAEMDKVKRWSESKKEHVMVDRPLCVRLHNKYMGSVDNNDRMISYYRIKAKTKNGQSELYSILSTWFSRILGYYIRNLKSYMVIRSH